MRNIKIVIVLSFIFSFVIIQSCKKEPIILEEPDAPYYLNINNFPEPSIAIDNPLTREGVKLGQCYFMKICFLEPIRSLVQVVIFKNSHLLTLQDFQ